MAILPGFPGVQVTIQSDKKDLPEYLDESDWSQKKYSHLTNGQRTTSYVECVSNAEFEIAVEIEPALKFETESISVLASVDGKNASMLTIRPAHLLNCNGSYKASLDVRERLSATEVSKRALKFSSINKVDSVDSDRVREDAKLVTQLGVIVVTVHRSYRGEMKRVRSTYKSRKEQAPTEIAEKSLKGQALSHSVQYGPPKTIQRNLRPRIVFTDGGDNPIGVYVFKYRSKDALKSELIIPRSPSPEIAHAPRRGSEQYQGETRDEKLARLKREIALIKDEDGESNLGKRKHGPEVGQQKSSKASHSDIVVVDLTEDE